MTKRLSVLLIGVCLGVLGQNPSVAMNVAVDGTFTDEVADVQGTWEGQFQVSRNNLRGSVTLTGLDAVDTVEVVGSIDGDQIAFNVVGDARVPGDFTARRDGNTLSGTFAVGNRRGRWQGAWRFAPGEPRPPFQAEAAEVEAIALPDTEAGFDADDPRAGCRLLQNEVMMGVMSPARAESLRRFCAGTAALAAPGWRTQWARSLRPLGRWVAAYWPAVGAVLAQPPESKDVDTSPESWSEITQTSPSIASIPAGVPFGDLLVAAYWDSRHGPAQRISISRSVNGGTNWDPQGAFDPANPLGTIDGEPAAAAARVGLSESVFVAYLGTAPTKNFIGVSRSTDLGLSWEAAVDVSANVAPSSINDKPEIIVDNSLGAGVTSPYAGNVYVCWTVLTGSESRVWFARSTNDGVSFGPALDLGVPGDRATNCSVEVGPAGDVYVGWWDFASDRNRMVVRRSTDGGASFQNPAFLSPPQTAVRPTQLCSSPGSNLPVLNGDVHALPAPSLAADKLYANTVYAVWDTVAAGSAEVLFSRSSDNGATWLATPVVLNASTTNDQFLPRVSTVEHPQPASVIRAMWYDRRDDAANVAVHVYSASSTDLGLTWSEEQITPVVSPLPQLSPNFDCEARDCVLSDTLTITNFNPENSNFLLGWTDTRDPSGPPGFECAPGRGTLGPDPDIRVTVVGC